MDYSKIFPEEKADKIINKMETYVVRLSLIEPKDDYDFNKNCEGIKTKETFLEAVRMYNKHPARAKDGARISSEQIRTKDIVFTLTIKTGFLKSMSNTIGNSLSKWLYENYQWNKLTIPTPSRHKLFNVEYVPIFNCPQCLKILSPEKSLYENVYKNQSLCMMCRKASGQQDFTPDEQLGLFAEESLTQN